MKFSIVTPSFKQPQWLRLCLASVADQRGDFKVEHIVQDNCSGPETEAVVAAFPHAQLITEQDKGMYDAVNRGLKRSTGDICAYLNCDEQYLPGALEKVARFFQDHPEIDVLFGDCILVRPDGGYLCSRQVLPPHYYHTKICYLNTFTAATFIRRRVIDRENHYFNTKFRDAGDCVWVLGLMDKKIPFQTLGAFTSTFTDTGENMNLGPNGRREALEVSSTAPAWARALAPGWAAIHRTRKLLAGHYWPHHLVYSIFTQADPTRRTSFDVEKTTAIWWSRLSLSH